jgi:hypothetical protein
LQTEDYARAILAVSPGVTEDEVNARLAARMKRQTIVTRDHRPRRGSWRTKLRFTAASAPRRSQQRRPARRRPTTYATSSAITGEFNPL